MKSQAHQVERPLSFSPRSAEFRSNPYPTYDYLRQHHPIQYRPQQKDWVLTRYVDVLEALKNPKFGRARQEITSLQHINNQSADRFLQIRQDSQNLMKLWLVLLQ